MTKTVLLASAAALVLSAGAASAGAVHPGLSAKANPAHHVIVFPHNASVLYDQSQGDNGIGIISQQFTDFSGGTYDAQGADDFTVPAGKTWKVTEVDASGVYFNGSGPADSFNVTFYSKIKGSKEKVKASCNNANYTDTGFGSPAIKCSANLNGGTKGKTYYVSVQAVMAFGNGGEWGWNTNNAQAGKPGLWKNPGGGFGTGCTNYTPVLTCIPSGEGPDFAFALQGSSN